AAPQGYIGPGTYILPLDKTPLGLFRITRIPPSPGYFSAYVNVQIWFCPADALDWAADLAHHHLGVDTGHARDQLKKVTDPAAMGPVNLARNVPRDRAVAFMNEFLKKADKAVAFIPGNDIRIYPLTPETREQLDE